MMTEQQKGHLEILSKLRIEKVCSDTEAESL